LFSTVAGGGLLGCGAIERGFRTGSGARGGMRCGDGPLVAIRGVDISGALGTGLFVPGGAVGAAAGMI
jgi:hypothetical protein